MIVQRLQCRGALPDFVVSVARRLVENLGFVTAFSCPSSPLPAFPELQIPSPGASSNVSGLSSFATDRYCVGSKSKVCHTLCIDEYDLLRH